jgi:hypothetical protein
MKTLYNSFSGLLYFIRTHGMEGWKPDDKNTFYFFGCSKQGIDRTFSISDSKGLLPRAEIMARLEAAEKEGRVYWRTDDLEKDQEWFANVFGVPMEEVYSITRWGHFNLPAMHELFAKLGGVRVIQSHSFITEPKE